MDKKNNQQFPSYLETEELSFTKEDREETFRKIRYSHTTPKRKSNLLKAMAPTMAALAVVALTIILLPSFSANDNQQANFVTNKNNQNFSLLLMGKESKGHRNPINILFTFNPQKENAKVISFPRDLYVDGYSKEGEKLEKTKLLHVGAYHSDPAATIKSITNYLNVPVDYYASMPIEEIFSLISISKEKKERTIQQNSLVHLLQENGMLSELMIKLSSSQQTNVTEDIFDQLEKDYRYEVIHLDKGLEQRTVEGIYYVELESAFLKKITEELNNHLAG